MDIQNKFLFLAKTIWKKILWLLSKPLGVLFISVLLSIIFSSIFIRSCWESNSSWGSFLCGNVGRELRDFRWLDLRQFTAASNGPESYEYSIKRGTSADKLIDGLLETQAYPAQKEFDYTIDFLESYEIDRIEFVWGVNGENSDYVKDWMLSGKTEKGDWKTLAEGGFPGVSKTMINTSATISALRIQASGKVQWIGIYELRVRGRTAL